VIASVSTFLAQVRRRGAEIPPALTGALLLAAVRLSEQKSHPVRPELLLVGEDGALDLVEGTPAPVDADPYAAPELRKGSSPARDQGVLVYAAGALGYELVTLSPLSAAAGVELSGPLAPVVRKAVSQDRRQRYRDLGEMAHAIEEIQARPSEDEERMILAAVATTLPAPRQLAKVELKKVAVPSPYGADPAPEEPDDAPAQLHPVFARHWDPLEAPEAVFFQNGQEAPEPGVLEMRAAEVQQAHQPEPADPIVALRAELKERREEMVVLESRVENLSRLVARISAIEERLRSQPAPALSQELKLLLERRARPGRGALFLSAAGGATAGAIGLALVVSLASHRSVPPPAPQLAAPRPPDAPTPPLNPPVNLNAKPARPRKLSPATDAAAQGDKALRSFNTSEALSAFEAALKLDPGFPAAHRGLGTVYVLQGKNAEARVAFEKYLMLAPDAPDAEQIKRQLAR
jgi:tetratricopeptide (TPR) repeat protein